VTLLEAGHYPRHRVCGEFLSGRGQALFHKLGLEDKLARAGTIRATKARFFLRNRDLGEQLLPAPASCLPRYTLDDLLSREFKELGGQLRQDTRWRQAHRNAPEGVVLASGRRLRPVEHGARWVGLKAHFRGLLLLSDLEMHLFANGYIGLSRLSDNRVNVCGLFRLPTNRQIPIKGRELLLGRTGSALHERLLAARIDETSFCAVAGLSLAPAGFGR